MKYLSSAHLQKLEAHKTEQFLLDCVEKLEQMDIEGAFPPKREDYFSFAEHIYKVAMKYGFEEKSNIWALMLAWHVSGDGISADQRFVKVLNDPAMSDETKAAYFKKLTLDKMSQEEKV